MDVSMEYQFVSIDANRSLTRWQMGVTRSAAGPYSEQANGARAQFPVNRLYGMCRILRTETVRAPVTGNV